MKTYKFECEDATILIDCKTEVKALTWAQEFDMKLVGEANKEDLEDLCCICGYSYDHMHLEACPNCGDANEIN